jgi:hypothetical protein
MPEPVRSLITRFLALFVKEFWKALWAKVIDAAFVLAAIVYAGKSGRLSAYAWRASVLDVAFPFIWAMCAIALIHLVRTGVLLSKQISAENAASQPTRQVSRIFGPDGQLSEKWEMPKLVKWHRSKILGIVILLSCVPLLLSYSSWVIRPRSFSSENGSPTGERARLHIERIQWLELRKEGLPLNVTIKNTGPLDAFGLLSSYVFYLDDAPVNGDLERSRFTKLRLLSGAQIPEKQEIASGSSIWFTALADIAPAKLKLMSEGKAIIYVMLLLKYGDKLNPSRETAYCAYFGQRTDVQFRCADDNYEH